ncbi:tRNA (adenosine(37)-N6)-threonylcarbamoyltransferase complex transferase subunit TsaD [bacterium]|nr:tRNA (adenosine(37)-N6)-threonylcarbamoyltransferase complex transferase subunit TsaD [bacterium]
MLVLAVESSCDECSVAVLRDGLLLAESTETQTIHRQYGGVVPELAGRTHLELMDRMASETIARANQTPDSLDVIAATVGPGLVGSLLVGAMYAQGLALAVGKPFVGIHHVEAHLWAAEMTAGELPLPFLVLLASGGHTLLVRVAGLREYHVLGTTLDDALGEAYDKIGKLAGFDFPAGAAVDRVAAKGDPHAFELARPMDDGSCNFSFSGLKTAFLYRTRALPPDVVAARTPDLLASFQEAALESVMQKVRRAVKSTQIRALVAAGGVAANSQLRAKLKAAAEEAEIEYIVPPPRYCMDNAAMIAYLAWKLSQREIPASISHPVRPRWPLSDLVEGDKAP